MVLGLPTIGISGGNILETPRCEHLDPVAHRPEFVDDVRRGAALPRDEDVRAQQRKLLMVDGKCVSYHGQCPGRGRKIGVGAGSDQRVPCAGGKDEFGQVGSEGDEAGRSIAHLVRDCAISAC